MKKCISNLNLFLLVLPLFTVSINQNEALQANTLKASELSSGEKETLNRSVSRYIK